jgi:DegV family protein with EDD domain
VVPLTVRFGDEELRDGVDIDTDAFYARLRTTTVNPTTSQPTPSEFADVYRALLAAPDDQVVSLHIAQTWSGTIQSATLAAKDFEGRVRCVDSHSVSAGLQFLVRGALRDIGSGADADEVVRNCEGRSGRIRVWVMLDTLTYLQRGGRIGRARALVGSVLNIKPVLEITHGEARDKYKARRPQQGMDKMLEWAAAEGPAEMVGMMSSLDHPLAGAMREALSTAYPELEILSGELGPVVGTYAGPDSLGLALLRAS